MNDEDGDAVTMMLLHQAATEISDGDPGRAVALIDAARERVRALTIEHAALRAAATAAAPRTLRRLL